VPAVISYSTFWSKSEHLLLLISHIAYLAAYTIIPISPHGLYYSCGIHIMVCDIGCFFPASQPATWLRQPAWRAGR
jgi:hypothetical protein